MTPEEKESIELIDVAITTSSRTNVDLEQPVNIEITPKPKKMIPLGFYMLPSLTVFLLLLLLLPTKTLYYSKYTNEKCETSKLKCDVLLCIEKAKADCNGDLICFTNKQQECLVPDCDDFKVYCAPEYSEKHKTEWIKQNKIVNYQEKMERMLSNQSMFRNPFSSSENEITETFIFYFPSIMIFFVNLFLVYVINDYRIRKNLVVPI